MATDPVLDTAPLGAPPWPTLDPFLFCVHHDDAYPAGNEQLGPAASLAGRDLGMDFAGKDGWRMYHGDVVPGFPQHPHRGFETVTLARRGFIDHSDSLGATARFGTGDAQWLTAGQGIVHSEMFPLLDPAGPNPVELFQIWLNLPRADKLAAPHFTMMWADTIPVVRDGGATVTVVAGALGDAVPPPPPPPPRSWAARPDSDVAIWSIVLDADGRWTLPAARAGSHRTLYVFRGGGVTVGERAIPLGTVVLLHPDQAVPLAAGPGGAELLLLQGRPIGEPVVQHGPFVMNSPGEIQQAFHDYRRTQFGGWPWPVDGPVHARDAGRFARHVDGRIEQAR
ncbi:MAG: pirin family protein [Kofleriaceae bacterium]|nr:pirin family protein [Kofleriaceae bacterium]MCL4224480.1 pirin family protein [Myxococcales bacterium]